MARLGSVASPRDISGEERAEEDDVEKRRRHPKRPRGRRRVVAALSVRREVDLPRDWMAMRGPRTGSEMARHREFTTSCRRGRRAVDEAVTSDIGTGHQVSGVVLDPSSVA